MTNTPWSELLEDADLKITYHRLPRAHSWEQLTLDIWAADMAMRETVEKWDKWISGGWPSTIVPFDSYTWHPWAFTDQWPPREPLMQFPRNTPLPMGPNYLAAAYCLFANAGWGIDIASPWACPEPCGRCGKIIGHALGCMFGIIAGLPPDLI